MNKLFLCLLLSLLCFNNSFGQATSTPKEENTKITVPFENHDDDIAFIFKVKNYTARYDDRDGKIKSFEISPDWIKSIEVVKNAEGLESHKIRNNIALIIITFKNSSWKKLPDNLKKDLKKEED